MINYITFRRPHRPHRPVPPPHPTRSKDHCSFNLTLLLFFQAANNQQIIFTLNFPADLIFKNQQYTSFNKVTLTIHVCITFIDPYYICSSKVTLTLTLA